MKKYSLSELVPGFYEACIPGSSLYCNVEVLESGLIHQLDPQMRADGVLNPSGFHPDVYFIKFDYTRSVEIRPPRIPKRMLSKNPLVSSTSASSKEIH